MSIKKDIKEIKASLKLIEDSSFRKAALYETQKNLLDDIHIKVDKVTEVFNGSTLLSGVKVEYSIPTSYIYLDDNGDEFDNMFKSINKLNLISFADMKKIRDKIEEVRKK